MHDEYNSLMANQTWTWSPLPCGRKATGSRWVFKLKTDENGEIARDKARFVAKRFSQRAGVDFDETFAPTLNKTSLRIVVSIAASQGWPIENMDALTAFLNGNMDYDVYIDQPEGLEIYSDTGERLYCRLNKAIYGLKQAGRTWWQTLMEYLSKIGFEACSSDVCLLTRRSKNATIIWRFDDFIITGSCLDTINEFKTELSTRFKMKDLGNLHLTLGIKVDRTESGAMILSQEAYTSSLLRRFKMADSRPTSTPQIAYQQSSSIETTQTPNKPTFPYREAVGALIYLSSCTRPDISVAVNRAARRCANPSSSDVIAVKRIMRYLAGTSNLGIRFEPETGHPNLRAYVDADWASDKVDRRSISGFMLMLNGPVHWGAVKQSCVALSTAEAEYVALSRAAQEIIWVRQALKELEFEQPGATVVYEDNAAALIMATKSISTGTHNSLSL